MDWANERYVRLYTRDSSDMIAVRWEGRLVLYELLRKVDRAGVLEHGGDLDLVPDMLRLPPEICQVGLERLVARGVVALTSTGMVLPNFLEAQDAIATDAHRKRESRARNRERAMANVTRSDATVTGRDLSVPGADVSVTRGHARSRAVTFGHDQDDPDKTNQTNLIPPSPPRGPADNSTSPSATSSPGVGGSATPPGRTKAKRVATPAELEGAAKVLEELNRRSGSRFQPVKPNGELTGSGKLIVRLLRDGYTVRDLRLVAWDCSHNWLPDPEMRRHLTPETVFGPEKFPTRLATAQKAHEEATGKPEAPPAPPVLALPGFGGGRAK